MRRVAVGGLLGRDLAAAAQHADAVGNLQHLIELVADEDHGVARRREIAQRLEQFARLRRRQHGGRLVEDQHARLAASTRRISTRCCSPAERSVDPRVRAHVEVELLGERRASAPRARAEAQRGVSHQPRWMFSATVKALHQLEMLMHHADAGGDRLDAARRSASA